MQNHLHPLNGYVLLKLAEAESRTAAGIYRGSRARQARRRRADRTRRDQAVS